MSYSFGLKLSKLAQRLARLKGAAPASQLPPRPATGVIALTHNFFLLSAPAGARVEYTCLVAMVAAGTAPITAACVGRPGFPAVRAARLHRLSRHGLVAA